MPPKADCDPDLSVIVHCPENIKVGLHTGKQGSLGWQRSGLFHLIRKLQ